MAKITRKPKSVKTADAIPPAAVKTADAIPPATVKTADAIPPIEAKIAELLKCAVCLEIMLCPVTIKCQHSFCRQCIAACSDSGGIISCPMCRSQSRSTPSKNNTILSAIIEHVAPGKSLRGVTASNARAERIRESNDLYNSTPDQPGRINEYRIFTWNGRWALTKWVFGLLVLLAFYLANSRMGENPVAAHNEPKPDETVYALKITSYSTPAFDLIYDQPALYNSVVYKNITVNGEVKSLEIPVYKRTRVVEHDVCFIDSGEQSVNLLLCSPDDMDYCEDLSRFRNNEITFKNTRECFYRYRTWKEIAQIIFSTFILLITILMISALLG